MSGWADGPRLRHRGTSCWCSNVLVSDAIWAGLPGVGVDALKMASASDTTMGSCIADVCHRTTRGHHPRVPSHYVGVGSPNQVVSASGSLGSVRSPTQATCASGRINTAVGAVTSPSTGSSHTPTCAASTSCTRAAHGAMSNLPSSGSSSISASAISQPTLLDHCGETKLQGLLRAGDPRGEVAYAWHAKGAVRFLDDIPNPELAGRYLEEFAVDLQHDEFPPEVRSLGRTLTRWRDQIVAWHRARATNGPAEAVSNLVKRGKCGAFGFRQFQHYRIRSLLYAGRYSWHLLDTITPR